MSYLARSMTNATEKLIAIILIGICLTSLVMNAVAIQGTEKGNEASREQGRTWIYKYLWGDDEHLNDMVIADMIPTIPGNEIYTVGNSYYATMVSGTGDSWRAQRIYRDDFYLRAIAAGDVYPGNPGIELILVGYNTYVILLYYNTTTYTWHGERIYQDYDFLHDVAIGDIDPSHPGDEIVTVGESRRLSYVYYNYTTNGWSSDIIWSDKDSLFIVTANELVDPQNGIEIVVTGRSFDITLISRSGGGWSINKLWHDSTYVQEMAIKQPEDENGSGAIFVAGYSERLTMLSRNALGNWVNQTLYTDKTVLNDILILEYDQAYDGPELVIPGGDGDINLLYHTGKGWLNRTLYNVANPPTRIAFADFDMFHAGSEFAIIEYIGKLTMIYPECYDFSFVAPIGSVYAYPGESFNLDLLAISNGGFDELVHLNFETLGDGGLAGSAVNIKFEPSSVIPTDFATVTITVAEASTAQKLMLTFVAASESARRYANVTLQIIESDETQGQGKLSGYDLDLDPRISYLVADYSTTVLAAVSDAAAECSPQELSFTLYNAPLGVSISNDLKFAKSNPDTARFLLTLRSDTNVPAGTYYIFIHSSMTVDAAGSVPELKLDRARILKLNVEGVSAADFFIELSPRHDIELHPGENFTSNVGLDTIGGFDGTVKVELENSDADLTVGLFPDTVTRDSVAKLMITASENINYSKRYIILTASFNDRLRFDIVAFDVLPFEPTFEITIEPEDIVIWYGGTAGFNVTVSPYHGFNDTVVLRLYHIAGMERIWENYSRSIEVDRIAIAAFRLDNFTHTGTFKFRVFAVAESGITSAANLTVSVRPRPEPPNGGNGDADDADSNLNAAVPVIFALLIIIVIIVIIIVYGRSSRRGERAAKRAPAATGEKGQDTRTLAGLGVGRRRAGKQVKRTPAQQEKLKQSQKPKAEREREGTKDIGKNQEFYKLGERIYRPGGRHEYDDLAKEEPKPPRKGMV